MRLADWLSEPCGIGLENPVDLYCDLASLAGTLGTQMQPSLPY